jgi:hypothetical protein
MDQRISDALDIAVRYGGIDGDHHKAWVIDQMVRCLTGCPKIPTEAVDSKGQRFTYERLGESDEYSALVKEACEGDDGPTTYSWSEGVAP